MKTPHDRAVALCHKHVFGADWARFRVVEIITKEIEEAVKEARTAAIDEAAHIADAYWDPEDSTDVMRAAQGVAYKIRTLKE